MTSWVRRQSFQRRLTALVAVAVGIALVLVAAASYLTVSRQLGQQVDQKLEGYAHQIQQAAAEFGGGAPPSVLRVADQSGNVVELAPRNSTPISFSGQSATGTPTVITPTRRQMALAGDFNAGYRLDTVSYNGVHYRVITVPASANGTPAVFLIYTNIHQTLTTLARLRLLLYVLLLAGIAVAVVLGFLVARVTIRPVKRLTAAAEHVALTQQLDATIDDDGTDELGRLAHAFNEMLGALRSSRQQQAQLVSDAGHELRTPLTSLRTNVELMTRAGQLPEADQQELYGDITGQIEELTTLIGDLVELARQDEQQPEPVEVRLDDIVERAVQRAERRAPTLSFDVAMTPGSVRAQPPMLERAVLNVLDNAAKWSPPGGTVHVRVTRGAEWVLEVRDAGPGIAAEDIPKVFDRFYRAPSARSMPGSGLGLAIVRQVVNTHGGQVTLESSTGGGTTVRIELPVVVEQEPGAAGTLAVPGMPPVPPMPPPSVPPPTTFPAPSVPEDRRSSPHDVPAEPGGRPTPAGVSGPRSGRATP